MNRRPFAGSEDLRRLQDFTARQIKEHGRSGMMHPGDVPHRIYNALRRDDPRELVHIWEDDAGEIAGWTLLDPRGAGFDSQIAPGMRTVSIDLEREIAVWSEETLLALMRSRHSEATAIETEVFESDVARTKLLGQLGWIAQNTDVAMLTRRSLADIDDPQLPSGYKIRTVRGVDEAGPVSELHSAGFGSSWTPALYKRVMESPGYKPEREIVIEAPDGTLAGFCVTWPDYINRTGLFEPVAVHPDHRRRHLGSALMRAGMAAMAGWGMDWAEVMYETENPGSEKLYRGEGFKPRWKIVFYRKPISL